MMIAAGIAVIAAWVVTPNVALVGISGNRAGEEAHIAASAAAFIPWTIFGLYLVG